MGHVANTERVAARGLDLMDKWIRDLCTAIIAEHRQAFRVKLLHLDLLATQAHSTFS